MKHLLNNLSEEEKNSIREHYAGGMTVMTDKFHKLVESKLGDVKLFLNEQDGEITPEIIIGMLMKGAESTPQEDYDDPYDWMQDIFSPVELELEEMGFDIDDLRMEYDDVLLGLWNQNDDDNEF
jgi:hypothetical protein